MQEWTNLFDIGECTVEIYDGSETVTFSAVMAKDSSSAFSYFGSDYAVAVSAAGVVSLSIVGDAVSNSMLGITVVPSYAHDYPARIVGAVTDDAAIFQARGGINAGVVTNIPAGDGTDYLEYTAVDFTAPDPLDMTALTGARDAVGVSWAGGV